jgi:hypothetical protein
MKQIRSLVLFVCLSAVLVTCGCGIVKSGGQSQDIEYTVVADDEIPDELAEIIQDKCQNPFKLTYATKEYLYLVAGYGAQLSGGYSICVNSLYKQDETIHFDTDLIGPENGESVAEGESYPYIVVKIKYVDAEVVFGE